MRRRKTETWVKWRGLVCEQNLSGVSIAEFCRQRGLHSNQFFAWKRRLLEDAEKPHAETPQFVAVKVASENEPKLSASVKHRPAIEVRLGRGNWEYIGGKCAMLWPAPCLRNVRSRNAVIPD